MRLPPQQFVRITYTRNRKTYKCIGHRFKIPSTLAKHCLCGNKMPTRCNRRILLQILLFAQRVSGTITPIIRSSGVLHRWLLPVVFGALVFKLSVWCGAEGYVSGLRADAAARKPQRCTQNSLNVTNKLSSTDVLPTQIPLSALLLSRPTLPI